MGIVTHWFDVENAVSYVTITAVVGIGLEFPVLGQSTTFASLNSSVIYVKFHLLINDLNSIIESL